MYRLALDLKANRIVLIAGILLAASLLAMVLQRTAFAQEGPIEFPENSKDAVATFTAEDPEGATPIAWHVATTSQVSAEEDLATADNADAASFEIDEDGMLKFMNPPDFENPAGTNATPNTYKVVVVACDVALGSDGACPDSPDGQAAYHAVTVKVTKVDEPGKVTLTTSTTGGTPQYLVSATLTAEASDGDITGTQIFTDNSATGVSGVTWRWYRGSDEITANDAQDNTYTLVQDDAGQHIRAVAFYVVAGNVDQESASLTTEYPVLTTRFGDNKLKFDPAAVTRTITEGDKDRNVGAPVTATGNHGTVRYTLAGDGADNARFDIDAKTGQITTALDLDYEGEDPAAAGPPVVVGSCSGATDDAPDRTCTVTVRATDSYGTASATAIAATDDVSVECHRDHQDHERGRDADLR